MPSSTPIGANKAPARRVETRRSWQNRAAFDLAGLLVLASGIVFFHLGSHGLWEPDEARYAEIGREMLVGGDWIVPHLNYVAYVEKPPLLYWLIASSYRILGVSEFAARLPVALSALAGLAVTWKFAVKSFGRRQALLTGAMLATVPLYAVMAQVLTTDMLLTAMVTAALFAFFLHWHEGGRWCWIAYASMGLAILTKGPVGLLLPASSILAFLWWRGDLAGFLRRFQVLPGLALTAAIAAAWFIAVTIREPGFFDFYVVNEHLRRFFEPGYSHGEPIYYYIPVLAAGLLPYFLGTAWAVGFRREPNPAREFCVVSAVVIVAIFSLASAKLIPYILPAIPPIVVLIADAAMPLFAEAEAPSNRLPRRTRWALCLPAAGLVVIGAGAILAALLADHFRSPYPAAIHDSLLAIGAITVVGGSVAAAFSLRMRPKVATTAAVLTMAAALIAGSHTRLEAEPLRSYARLSRTVSDRAPGAALVCYHRYVQSLAFYCRSRVILVGPKSELSFGAARAPDAAKYFYSSDEDAIRLFRRPRRTVMVIDRPDLRRLKDRLGPFKVIASEHRKVAIVAADKRNGRD